MDDREPVNDQIGCQSAMNVPKPMTTMVTVVTELLKMKKEENHGGTTVALCGRAHVVAAKHVKSWWGPMMAQGDRSTWRE